MLEKPAFCKVITTVSCEVYTLFQLEKPAFCEAVTTNIRGEVVFVQLAKPAFYKVVTTYSIALACSPRLEKPAFCKVMTTHDLLSVMKFQKKELIITSSLEKMLAKSSSKSDDTYSNCIINCNVSYANGSVERAICLNNCYVNYQNLWNSSKERNNHVVIFENRGTKVFTDKLMA